MDTDAWLTRHQLAQQLGVTRQRVRQLLIPNSTTGQHSRTAQQLRAATVVVDGRTRTDPAWRDYAVVVTRQPFRSKPIRS